MAVTINDVARLAGVSVSTVSRAVNTPDRVNAATLDKVRRAAAELGYTPNQAARALRDGKTGSLGLVIPDIANPFFPPILKAMQERARRQGYTVLVADGHEREADERDTLSTIARKVDGLVVWAPVLPDTALSELAGQLPVVLVNREVEGVTEIHIDLTDGVAQAAEHLEAYGHTHCLFINANGQRSDESRPKSIRETLDAHGMSFVEVGPYEPRFETGVLAAPLIRSHGATAVLAHNDLVAMGVLHQLAVLGVSVPDEVSVVGIDDTLLASVSTPSLTTVRISPDEVAATTVDRLVALIERRESPGDRITVGSRLIPRGTTRPAPTAPVSTTSH